MTSTDGGGCMPFARRKFKLRSVSQMRSPLLRLPAELRIKILRNLTKSPNIIRSLLWLQRDYRPFEAGEPFRETTRLSSQLLRCCQQLHTEGVEILYGENILQLSFFGLRFEMLEEAFQIPITADYIDDGFDSLTSWAEDAPAVAGGFLYPFSTQILENVTAGQPEAEEKNEKPISIRNLPALFNFKKLYINMENYCDNDEVEAFFIFCRALAPYVFHKYVTLDVPEGEWYDRALKSCRVWECRAITFKERAWSLWSTEVEAKAALDFDRCVTDTLPLLKETWVLSSRLPEPYPRDWRGFADFRTAVFACELDETLRLAVEVVVERLKPEIGNHRLLLQQELQMVETSVAAQQAAYDVLELPDIFTDETYTACRDTRGDMGTILDRLQEHRSCLETKIQALDDMSVQYQADCEHFEQRLKDRMSRRMDSQQVRIEADPLVDETTESHA